MHPFLHTQVICILTLGSTLLSHSCSWEPLAGRQKTAAGDVALGFFFLSEGSCCRRQCMLSLLLASSFACSPPAVPSYDAVQRWVDELRVHVGEAGELALVDVGDDQLVRGGQHGLRAGEELVEVFSPFAALKDTERKT